MKFLVDARIVGENGAGRRFFSSKGEAEAYAQTQRARRQNEGSSSVVDPFDHLARPLSHLGWMHLVFRSNPLHRLGALNRFQCDSCLELRTVDSSLVFHVSVSGFPAQSILLFITIPLAPFPRAPSLNRGSKNSSSTRRSDVTTKSHGIKLGENWKLGHGALHPLEVGLRVSKGAFVSKSEFSPTMDLELLRLDPNAFSI
jgi:hypothetical protein